MKKTTTPQQREAMYARTRQATHRQLNEEETQDLLSWFPTKVENPRLIRNRADEADELRNTVEDEISEEGYERHTKKTGMYWDCDYEVRRKNGTRDTARTEDEDGRAGDEQRDIIEERKNRQRKAKVEKKLRAELAERTRKTAEEKQTEHDRKIGYMGL